jgi:hypothetical protein
MWPCSRVVAKPFRFLGFSSVCFLQRIAHAFLNVHVSKEGDREHFKTIFEKWAMRATLHVTHGGRYALPKHVIFG